MSNVTNLKPRGQADLERREARIIQLATRSYEAQQKIGVELLAIKEGGYWEETHASWFKYLDTLSDRMLHECGGGVIPARNLELLVLGASFGRSLREGKIGKKYQAFFDNAAPSTQGKLAELCKTVIKDSATPINEAAALRQLCDNGYFNVDEPLGYNDVTEVRQHRARGKSPDRLAADLEFHAKYLIDILDEQSPAMVRQVFEYAAVRRVFRRLRTIAERYLNQG